MRALRVRLDASPEKSSATVGPVPTETPSDHDCGWRCPARAGYRERRDTSTEGTRRTRPENTASRTSDRDSTGGQAADDTLARIAPEQQRQRQQSGRRKLDGHARVHHGGDRDCDDRDQKQSKHKMRARTASKHARNIHTLTPEVQSANNDRDRRRSLADCGVEYVRGTGERDRLDYAAESLNRLDWVCFGRVDCELGAEQACACRSLCRYSPLAAGVFLQLDGGDYAIVASSSCRCRV